MENDLRYHLRKIRQKLPDFFKNQASFNICLRIQAIEVYQKAKHVAVYYPINGEVNLAPLWENASSIKKSFYFPKINHQNTLSFLQANTTHSFQKSPLGIPEPQDDITHAISENKLDLIILPMVAFDESGTRLGTGGGYYDKTLQDVTRPCLIGVAYEFQKVPSLHRASWDIPMHLIVTEQSIYRRLA